MKRFIRLASFDPNIISWRASGQIEDTGYAEIFKEEGVKTILKYGIACYKKRCRVMLAE